MQTSLGGGAGSVAKGEDGAGTPDERVDARVVRLGQVELSTALGQGDGLESIVRHQRRQVPDDVELAVL